MKLAYVDSCIWIIRVEGLPKHKQIIDKKLHDLAEEGWMFCISEVVILEILAKLLKQDEDNLVQFYREAFDKIRILKNYPHVFRHALSIIQTENLKGMDAIHVAFADHYDCNGFVSSDSHFMNLKIIPPLLINLDDEEKERY
jgi:predicted nucleic acid-binding protein